jgi:hypothetical protein
MDTNGHRPERNHPRPAAETDTADARYDLGLDLDGEEPYLPDPPRPINWNTLSADQAETAWIELDAWVNWLRRTYGLPAAIVPPYWHRHPELVWELSALHLHWLGAYDPEQHGSAPIGWHRDFADTRERLREWVATSGTRLDRDRPTRQTTWPGEPPGPDAEEQPIVDRPADFARFVAQDVQGRRRATYRRS